MTIANTHKNAYTGSSITVATPSFGTWKYDEKGGTGMDRFDDMMPTAWEEVDGTGIGMGLQTVIWCWWRIWYWVDTCHQNGRWVQQYTYLTLFIQTVTYNSKKGASGTANGDSGRVDGNQVMI